MVKRSNPAILTFDREYFFLSNFYPIRVFYNRVDYASSEHAFQAAKAVIRAEHDAIRAAPTPGKAKRLGKQCTRRPDWEEVKLDIMKNVLRAKFNNPVMAQRLRDTGSSHLVEGNTWHDNEWGVCRCGRPACALAEGQNLLGKLLMKVRLEIGG